MSYGLFVGSCGGFVLSRFGFETKGTLVRGAANGTELMRRHHVGWGTVVVFVGVVFVMSGMVVFVAYFGSFVTRVGIVVRHHVL